MGKIIDAIDRIGLYDTNFILSCIFLLVGTLVVGTLGRFIFGKRSILNGAVSSAIGIIFIYIVTVLILQYAAGYVSYITPLPYVTITEQQVQLIQFQDAHYALLLREMLRLLILSFLVNLIDRWMPSGGNIFTWLLFRVITVFTAFFMHYIIWLIIAAFVPGNIMQYAPAIILIVVGLLLFTGALRIPIGAFLVSVNPVVAGLYTFFLANIIGKTITKAVLTTILLTVMFFVLNKLNLFSIALDSGALSQYAPIIPALFVAWLFAYKVL